MRSMAEMKGIVDWVD